MYILCQRPRVLDNGIRWNFSVCIALNYSDRYTIVGETNLDTRVQSDLTLSGRKVLHTRQGCPACLGRTTRPAYRG